MNGFVRFIIISALQPEIAGRFDVARQQVCAVGGSSSALAYPPHVTLRTGTLVPSEKVDSFIADFGRTAGMWVPFPVRTDGFLFTSYTDGPALKYLIAYKVHKGAALAGLNERLLTYKPWRATDRTSFEPHLTLAFDDLGLDGYLRAKDWLNENPDALPESFEWPCDNVGLYRQEGGLWTLFREWRQRSRDGAGATN